MGSYYSEYFSCLVTDGDLIGDARDAFGAVDKTIDKFMLKRQTVRNTSYDKHCHIIHREFKSAYLSNMYA